MRQNNSVKSEHMKVIGITGGVGAGKSEVLAYLERCPGCRVIMADRAAHRLEEPGEACYEPLTALLGTEILDASGRIDRQKMAARIFGDGELLRKVNGIVHPAVRAYDALRHHMKFTARAVTHRTYDTPCPDIQTKHQLSRNFHCFCHWYSPNSFSICV